METTTCIHHEETKSGGDDVELSTCNICGQAKSYDTLHRKNPPKIIKLGRINGAIVVPNGKSILALSLKEANELEAAKKATVLAPVQEMPAAIEKAKDADMVQEQPKTLRWYQDHKKEMIEDLLTMDYAAFQEKWKVKGQLVSHLKGDKLYKSRISPAETAAKPTKPAKSSNKRGKKSIPKPESHQRPPSMEEVTEAAKKGSGGRLPRFPDWAPDKWVSDEIAVQWLKTYETLDRLNVIPELGWQSTAPEKPAKKRGWFSRLFKRK